MKFEELLEFYSKSESVDQELFAEQRSNLQLISGEHYNKKGSRYWNSIRESRDIPTDQKLRLTKNHIQKIAKTYVNTIVSYAPSVTTAPNNDKEQQDQKAAELNNSVIQFAKHRYKIKDKLLQWAEDYVGIGEVAVLIYWDPFKGDLVGNNPVLDPMGMPVLDDNGNPRSEPVFTGDFCFDRVYGFNLLRDPNSTSVQDGKVCIRQMVDTKELKEKLANDPDKLKFVTESENKTFKVFDAATSGYSESKGQTLLLKFFIPKSVEHPNGYYYFTTLSGILWEGELPYGIWPLIYTGFDSIPTSPRHRSIVKHLRPYQVEINRTGSKIAEHQISIGDDKLIVTGGAKVSSSIQTPGIRTVHVSGGKADYLPGRSGDQYLGYMNANIDEMYQVANLDQELADKEPSGDILLNLFKSIKQKKKFTIYTDKFESFVVQFWETFLDLAKKYYPDEMVIPMIGRAEAVNMEEFRNTEKLCYQIKIEPQTDDLESMMGRQVTFNHLIQYVGPNMDKEIVGHLIKQMPFANWKAGFSEMTANEDMAANMILALDRGKVPMPNRYDDDKYMIRRLTYRTRQADFQMLHPKIQSNYDRMIQYYEEQEKSKQMEILEAQKGFIPSGGARVKADYYVPSPNNPAKTERATIPAEALDWLIKRLAEQGSSQEALQRLNQGAVAEIAASLNQQEAMALQGSGAMPQDMESYQ